MNFSFIVLAPDATNLTNFMAKHFPEVEVRSEKVFWNFLFTLIGVSEQDGGAIVDLWAESYN